MSTEEKRKILVVDDDKNIRKLLGDILRKTDDYEVDLAADGQEALEILEADSFRYNLVMTDMQMPRMSGEELLLVIREKAPELAVLIITAHKNDRNVLRCLELGAVDYITKPISVGQMTKTVRRTLERCGRFEGVADEFKIDSEVGGWVELTAPTDFEYVERFQKFTALLGDVPINNDAKEDIRVAIDELGQNAVEWGNRHDRNKQIHLSYCIFADRIIFKIEDEGEGFVPDTLPDPSIDPLQHIMNRMKEGKRAGGYGVYITKQLLDDVMYNDKGNVVILTKFFDNKREDS